jgi:hypothetical protein
MKNSSVIVFKAVVAVLVVISMVAARASNWMISAQGHIYVLTNSVTVGYLDVSGSNHAVVVAAGQSFNPFQDPTTGLSGTNVTAGKISPIPSDVLMVLQRLESTNGSGNVISNYYVKGTNYIYIRAN